MAAGGIHAGRGCNPQSENRKRAVGDAGPYGVQPSKYAGIQRCTDAGTIMAQGTINVVRGSGSGDRSTSDSLRNLFVPQSQSDGRKSKDHRSLAAFFSIFLSLLKEIWPPEAEKQDAGAALNRRTENGPSGTPAPTRDRRKCAGIRWCADAGRWGRRPLRRVRPET